ncbi:MAG: hypothetical protein MK171_03815 [Pirellulales bacterium]|nr:hypothetical protein [Pirellulales bacterium]
MDRSHGPAFVAQLTRVAVHAIGRNVGQRGELSMIGNPLDKSSRAGDMLLGSPGRAQLAFVVGQVGFNGPLRFLADRV